MVSQILDRPAITTQEFSPPRESLGAFALIRDEKVFAATLVAFCQRTGTESSA